MRQSLNWNAMWLFALLGVLVWITSVIEHPDPGHAFAGHGYAAIVRRVAGGGNGLPFAGNGAPARMTVITHPGAVSADHQGNVFFTDSAGANPRSTECEVREVLRRTGKVLLIAGRSGSGPAPRETPSPSRNVRLNGCNGVALGASGAAFVVFGQGLVGKINLHAGTIRVVAGGGQAAHLGDGASAVKAFLYGPQGLAVDAQGNLYIADMLQNRIRKVSRAGIITTVAGNGAKGFAGDGGKATAARLAFPQDVAVDNKGDVFIADYGNDRIREIVGRTKVIYTVAGGGKCATLRGLCGTGLRARSARLKGVHSVAVDRAGNLLLGANYMILRVDKSNGRIYPLAGNGQLPLGVASVQKQSRAVAALKAEISPVSLAPYESNVFVADDWINLIRELVM